MSEDTEDPKKIVRVYSHHAQDRFPPESDGYKLGRVLTDQEPSLEDILQPWRKFYEPWDPPEAESNPITKVLAIEAERLRKQWLDFRQQNSKDDQVEVKSYAPTVTGVIGMVADVEKSWQSKRKEGKRGRIMSYFHRLCGTLDSHSNMLEILPQGNEYVSIFAGTITTIIKASANHEAIADELSQALSTISEHVADCEIELELFKTKEMQEAIADLYSHIFLFLNDTLAWFTKKRRRRLLDSMNEKFLHEFDAEIGNIVQKSKNIKRKADRMAMAENRVTRLTVEENSKDMRLGLEGIRREHAETKHYARQFAEQFERQRREQREDRANIELLQRRLFMLLTDSAKANRESLSTLSIESGSPDRKRRSLIEMLSTEATITTRDQVLDDSKSLEDFFHRDRVRLEPYLFGDTQISEDALRTVAEWIKESAPNRLLYVASNDFVGEEYSSSESLLASKFIEVASDSGVSIISYFCELRRGEKLREGNSREAQGVLALMYGLLRQMIELFPMEFETDCDLSRRRFEELDGSLTTWTGFKSLFEDVQSVMRGKRMHCIIDGIQWLDDASTSECMTEIVSMLRLTNLKVLFTSSGFSRSLLEHLHGDELVQVDERAMHDSSLWQLEEGLRDSE